LSSGFVDLVRHPVSSDSVTSISAHIGRSAGSLKATFLLDGNLDFLQIPDSVPVRRGERLWQHTCFEIFLSTRMPAYREFNFSPSGEWAAYAFRTYRQEAVAVPESLRSLAIRRSGSAGQVELEAVISLGDDNKLAVGVSAVVESKSGALSYWALKHPAGKPDFHHPDSFVLTL
jgi:hypothetical protein